MSSNADVMTQKHPEKEEKKENQGNANNKNTEACVYQPGKIDCFACFVFVGAYRGVTIARPFNNILDFAEAVD